MVTLKRLFCFECEHRCCKIENIIASTQMGLCGIVRVLAIIHAPFAVRRRCRILTNKCVLIIHMGLVCQSGLIDKDILLRCMQLHVDSHIPFSESSQTARVACVHHSAVDWTGCSITKQMEHGTREQACCSYNAYGSWTCR